MSHKYHNESTYGRLADELHNYTKNGSRSKTTEQNKLKTKKSLIPKLQSNPDEFNLDAAASPEVKNTVKDIIKLLQGLDNISGGPQLTEFDEDDPNRPTIRQHKDEEGQRAPTSSGGKSGQPRPVRVSNIALKHDDPKYMRVTFEAFEPESSKNTTLKVNQKEETTSPLNVNSSQKAIKNKDFQSKSSVTASSSRKTIKDLVKIRPLKAVHDFRPKEQTSFTNRNHAENSSNSNEVIDLINNYKRPLDKDEARNNNEEERFYSFKTNNVYREPSLSIFLPSDDGRDSKLCSHRSQTNSYETSLPANFGAPYFRLDGSIMEDVILGRGGQNYVNINKFVKSAVQEQQNFYKEATDVAKHLKKKLVRSDSTQQQTKPRSKPKRQMF